LRPFLGPKVDIPTHYRRPLPPPTTFYHVVNFRLSDPAMNATIYGHFTEGFYLTPLTVVLVDGQPDRWITYRFKSCDGMREWKLRVLAQEVKDTMVTAIWICRAPRDPWASLKLGSTTWIDPNVFRGFLGSTGPLEVNHALNPFPRWPNLKPMQHVHSQ
jgi:hypothetical protein